MLTNARSLDLAEDFHRTNDMALATYLKLQGHTPQAVIWERATCYWLYRVTDHLLDSLDDFNESRALVEPKEYNKVFNQTKREFYDTKP